MINDVKLPRVSVAMAVYNGEKYLKDQIESILPQLDSDDELIISYNPSNDATIEIIEEYSKEDKRIKITKQEKKGVISNFSNAIECCAGEIIVLSDQDDVWTENKLKTIKQNFLNNEKLLLHDCIYVDKNLVPTGETLFHFRKTKTGYVRNLIRNSYQGCCMAFSRELKKYILPIPENVAMHDQWIGLVAEKVFPNEIKLIPEKLLLYRRYENNTSQYGVGLVKKIRNVLSMHFAINRRISKKD